MAAGTAYNCTMRPHHHPLFSVFFALCVFAGAQGALAQAPASADPPAPVADEGSRRIEQKTERIRIEDSGARVDEVRVGGQTKSTTVQPKADVPPYEIVPTDGTRAPPAPRQGAESKTGPRVWNVMKF